jgi:hypothetical protein
MAHSAGVTKRGRRLRPKLETGLHAGSVTVLTRTALIMKRCVFRNMSVFPAIDFFKVENRRIETANLNYVEVRLLN